MDPLSITAASFSIAGAIAKASIAIVEFSHQAKDASDDLQGVSRELQALAGILNPLTRNISRAPKGTVTAELSEQLESSLHGCALVVARIDSTIDKYQKDEGWTRTKWVLFGRGDMEKLRGSLEAYKMALSLGLQLISMAVEDSIKDDTGAIRGDTQALRNDVATVQVNTEEILARVVSLRNGFCAGDGSRTRQWVENMAVLSSYADSTYQETVIDLGEESENAIRSVTGEEATVRSEDADVMATPELYGFELPREERDEATRRKSDPSNHDMQEASDPPRKTTMSVAYIEGGDAMPSATAEGFRTTQQENQSIPADKVYKSVSPLPMNMGDALGYKGDVMLEPLPWRTQEMPRALSSGDAVMPHSGVQDCLDVFVALYLGQTSAAVAWMGPKTPSQAIWEWPGGHGPTVPIDVVCDDNQNVLCWGFPLGEDPSPRKPDPRLRLTLFLQQLYAHIRHTIVSSLGLKLSDWPNLGVEFLVSLPDTIERLGATEMWTRVGDFKSQLREAGIGTEGPRHYAMVSLTGRQAAITAALWQPLAPTTPACRIVLEIGTGDVAFMVYRWYSAVSKDAKRHFIDMPCAGCYIGKIVARWLEEKHPEICARLGPDGLGHLTLTSSTYRDVARILRGERPTNVSYRLHFDGFPEDFTHHAFDIKNGEIELQSYYLVHLFGLFVDHIADSVVDALAHALADALEGVSLPHEDLARILQDAVVLEAADTPKRLEKRIIDSIVRKSNAIYPFLVAAGGENTQAAQDSAWTKNVKLGTNPAPYTFLGDQKLSVVEGLILHRNPWNCDPGVSMRFPGLAPPHLYVRGRSYMDRLWSHPHYTICRLDESKTDPWYHPHYTICRLDESKTDPWPHNMPEIEQRWHVSNHRFDRDSTQRIGLDFYVTFNAELDAQELCNRGKLTKLCTVFWELSASHFRHSSRKEWWGRRVTCGSLDFWVHFWMLQPSASGSRFYLHVPGEEYQLPSSVEWHCEPPFPVWPAKEDIE